MFQERLLVNSSKGEKKMFDIKRKNTIIELFKDTYSCNTEVLFKVLLNQLEKKSCLRSTILQMKLLKQELFFI